MASREASKLSSGVVQAVIQYDCGFPAAPIGTEIAGLTTVMGVLLTKYLALGGDVNDIRKHLNSIKSDKPYGFGPKRVESIPHAMSVALSKFLAQSGSLKGQQL